MKAPQIAKNIIKATKKKPLVFDLFNQAETYNKAAQLLEQNGLIGPAILNCSFSIELLLKSLILIDHLEIFYKKDIETIDIDIKGHKYSELFMKINPENQNKILDLLGKKFNQTFTNESFFKMISVNGCEDPFVEWRYVFEENNIKTINYNFLITLSEVLGVFVLTNLKGLKQ